MHVLNAIIPNMLYACARGCGKFNLLDAIKHAVKWQTDVVTPKSK